MITGAKFRGKEEASRRTSKRDSSTEAPARFGRKRLYFHSEDLVSEGRSRRCARVASTMMLREMLNHSQANVVQAMVSGKYPIVVVHGKLKFVPEKCFH